jgi:TM2 domain-containing membrane protein YozV
MPDEGRCPHCGSVTPLTMPRCVQCGQRLFGTLLREEETDGYTEPWWRSSPGGIPLPPQLREEQARAEATAREMARFAEEQRIADEQARAHEAERLARRELREHEERVFWESQTHAVPAEKTVESKANKANKRVQTPPVQAAGQVLGNCTNCGSSLGEAGMTFSFCVHCGADVSVTPETQQTRPTPQTSRIQHEQTTESVAETIPETHSQRMVRTMTVTRSTETQSTTASPVAASFMSFLLPGIGQMMNGQGAKGVLLLLALFVTMGIFGLTAFGLPLLIGRILAAIDAYRIADRRRANEPVRDGEWDLG